MTESIENSGGGQSRRDIAVAIVQAVAEKRGVDPHELPPLYEWVDPEAVKRVFQRPLYGSTGDRQFVFEYTGHTVTVEQSEELSITVDDATTDPSAAGDSTDESRSDA